MADAKWHLEDSFWQKNTNINNNNNTEQL